MSSASELLHLDRLQNAIPRCEGKLKELKIIYEQSLIELKNPCEYPSQAHFQELCQSLVCQIYEELRFAVERPEAAVFTVEVPQEQPESGAMRPAPETCASPTCTDLQNEDSVIYVKEIPDQSNCQMVQRASRRRTSSGRKGNRPGTRTSPRRKNTSNAVVAPVPNEIYLAYWRMSKNWFAVLVLPLENVEMFGLSEFMPACYDCDKHTGQVGWKQGYENGGPLMADRQFPVMFFEGVPALDRDAVGWVAAKDLQNFDPDGSQASLISHYDSVLTFIRERQASQDGNRLTSDQHTDHGSEENGHNRSMPNMEGMPTTSIDQPTMATSLFAKITEIDTMESETRQDEPEIMPGPLNVIDSSRDTNLPSCDQDEGSGSAAPTSMSTADESPSDRLGRPDTSLRNAEFVQEPVVQTTTRTVTSPTSIFSTESIRVPTSDHSPTCYDLPPLHENPSKITESLPTIRPLIDTNPVLTCKTTIPSDRNICTMATYRNMEPRIMPVIDWPSLSKQKHKTQMIMHGEGWSRISSPSFSGGGGRAMEQEATSL
ncbi:hypothetical protein FPRO03_03453 [Fusarium proliferatum]|nr:hypothetical protein FPRO03_03453 [Fusarium proliferatum]